MWDRSENKIIIFIRHGLTASNVKKLYAGKLNDDELCDDGINELKENVNKGIYPKADLVISSAKKRCIQSAEIIYKDSDIKVVEGLDEIDFGLFEGKDYNTLKNNELYIKWLESGGTIPFPEGDSREDYLIRNKEAFERILNLIDEDKKRVAVVAHGGNIMALLNIYGGREYFDSMVSAGCGYICELIFKDEPKLKVIETI